MRDTAPGRLHFWTACLLLVVSAPAAAEYAVSEQQRYYEIDAVDLDGMRAQLADRRPIDQHGRTLHTALTRSEFEIDYTLVSEHGACHLDALRLTLDVTVTLPRWRPLESPPKRVIQRWERMLTALTRHEHSHRDNAVRAGQDLHTRLADMPSAPDCAELERAISHQFQRMLLRYQWREQMYDRRTRNGVEEGATL